MKKLISIVAPMYNEESLASEYCRETLEMIHTLEEEFDFEILLVNDGSRDNTYKIILQQQEKYSDIISIINLSRNFGLEGAVNAGLRKAVGDAVIVMDADLQDPPALIPKMIDKWKEGADIVVGSRVKRSNDNFFKKLSANCYYKVLDSLSGKLKLEKSAANFRLLSRKAVEQILDLPEVNPVFRVVAPFVGMKTDIVEYDRDKRFAGQTHYNLKSMIPYALNSITGISVEPLRKITLFIPIIFILFAIAIIGMFVTTGVWQVGFMLIAVMSFFFGFLFLSISILAEYIAQIMTEVKGRPISIIDYYSPCENVKRRVEE